MGILTSVIRKLPGGNVLADFVSFRRRKRLLESIGDAEARFTHIFAKNKWKDPASLSGSGSTLATTTNIRQALPKVIDEFKVGTLLDAPCGDFNWIRHTPGLSNIRYVGGDIVQPLIEQNRQQHVHPNLSFVHLDITSGPLPPADLWLCRDCLIHLSYDDIEQVLATFKRSAIRYWCVTTHRRIERNIDIPTGHCRMLNLEIPPFNFPAPESYIADDDVEETGKCLGLWERSQLLGLAVVRP